MAEFPSEIRIDIRRNRATGLIAAVSDDLPGLLTVGRDIAEIERRLPPSIAALIKAEFGVNVVVEMADGDNSGTEFTSLSTAHIQLQAA